MEAEIYTKSDTIDTLTLEQLDLIVHTRNDVLLHYLERTTIFDVHRIRLMLDLGASEAEKRLETLRSNTTAEQPARAQEQR